MTRPTPAVNATANVYETQLLDRGREVSVLADCPFCDRGHRYWLPGPTERFVSAACLPTAERVHLLDPGGSLANAVAYLRERDRLDAEAAVTTPRPKRFDPEHPPRLAEDRSDDGRAHRGRWIGVGS